jgi:hypothetical protein
MQIVDAEIGAVASFRTGTAPNYDKDNPIWKLIRVVEETALAAEREHYLVDSLQFVFPISSIALYGPAGDKWQISDPRLQDVKDDFQKQNLRDFTLTGVRLVRGFAAAGGWCGSFLKVVYSPLPGSPLVGADGVYRGDVVRLYLEVGDSSTGDRLINMPYDPATARYEVELWAAEDSAAADAELGPKGRAARERGTLLFRPDLVRGSFDTLYGAAFDRARREAQGQGVKMLDYAHDHSMHPIRPLRIGLAFCSQDGAAWDSAGGRNHRFEFSMSQRGWTSFLGVGESPNPHGGVGTLEYRNLYSNYFDYEERRRSIFGKNTCSELGRDLKSWNFDAYGRKPPPQGREYFLAVDYMDLHILRPNAVIGLHRHRDNQEVFLVLEGKGLMVVGDWAQPDERGRVFEVRTLRPGDLALVKGGGLHALANSLDEDVLLFMFGGYD